MTLKAKGDDRASLPIHKRKCKVCKEQFTTFKSMQMVCGWLCAAEWTKRKKERDAEEKAKQEKRQDRAKREELKTIPQLKKEAQREFNRFVRARDRAAGHPCICCGRVLNWDAMGGEVDAGHYRSTGSADHLRFHEHNCHAQRSDCNRYGAGRAVDYRLGLEKRIGLDALTALEANNESIKWTRDGLREIRDHYRREANRLEKA